ncbi:Salicylate hydroxylase [Akanthomyces lecanii RCEF 1005]|uniref:Salicylate hydroxylase n=1 Tax=Akanthomyces lecanii RCEF 1005 TaxID=1081108 RepID=A0A162LS35_CORDF|nr:Salicylate hydroxylase [Akanthomyces lecanii RCEF 1005]
MAASHDHPWLNIAIVGAGVAGVATTFGVLIEDDAKHRVTVLDARVLKKYGVAEEIEACSPELQPVNTRATELGPVSKFGASVADIDAEAERSLLTMENEETFLFDLVIASDEIRSKIPTKTVGSVNVIHPVTAYSINVDRETLKQRKD